MHNLRTFCLVILFSRLFAFVPNAVVRLREALLAGLQTTLALKFAFALFAQFSPCLVENVIYEVLAVSPLFLLFFSLWVLNLLRAVFVCSLNNFRTLPMIKRLNFGF